MMLTADPQRPSFTRTIADPATYANGEDPALAGAPVRDPRVSRSGSRGAEVPGAPSASPRPSPPKPPPSPTAAPSRPAPPPPPSPPASQPASLAQQVLNLVNAERGKAGCVAVHLDSRLSSASLGHSQDMAANDYFDHTGSDGSSPWDRAEAAGYASPSGENIAAGYQTAQDVMNGWMNSEGHRANILNCDSRAMGLGYVTESNRGPLWTQMFGFE